MKISLTIRPAEHAAIHQWVLAATIGGQVTPKEAATIDSLLARLLAALPTLPRSSARFGIILEPRTSPTRLRAPRSKLTHHHD